MQEKTKEMIKYLMDNSDKIRPLFWRDKLWLQEKPAFGIAKSGQLLWKDQEGMQETNWQNFFRKAKIEFDDREIQHNLADYMLLLKGDQLTAQDVVNCRNAVIRAQLLRDFGPERLIAELGGKVIHQEGTSQLIHVNMGKHLEHMRLVKVQDASTGEFYLLRVPPNMKTCKQAIAWTFELEEEEYDPVIET